mgnify:CR=1 FL=1
MFDKLTKAASLVPIIAAVYFTFRGFIGLGMTWELVGILTILFASLSWLLSQALLRFLDVKHNKAMAAAVIILGTAFLLTEASLTHIGLEWMLGQGDLHLHSNVIWVFSIFLSLGNVLTKWAFLGDPGEAKKQKPAASIFAGNEGKVIPIDQTTEDTLEEIARRVESA